jgi:hypothetical protein
VRLIGDPDDRARGGGIRLALTRLALRDHQDQDGRPEEMTRINTAYENARRGHVSEKGTDPLNAKRTYQSAQGR